SVETDLPAPSQDSRLSTPDSPSQLLSMFNSQTYPTQDSRLLTPDSHSWISNKYRIYLARIRKPTRSVATLIAISALVALPTAGGSITNPPLQIAKPIPVTETSIGKKVPGFIDHSLTPSPDGNHIAYVVDHGATKSVVFDGRSGNPYPDIPDQPL